MKKFFNTAGPIVKENHYHIPPIDRVDYEEIEMLIEHQKYFILHAPRQTGKTSTLLDIMERINSEGKYACCYANIEAAQVARGDVDSGVKVICNSIAKAIRLYLNELLVDNWLRDNLSMPSKSLLFNLLEFWSSNSQKSTILLLDEVDSLVGDTLISLLRQIRAGYAQRPKAFPQAMILCGVRDVRDYRIHTKDSEIVTGGSTFNIKAESLRMGNFTFEETKRLWLEHTEATNQEFDENIFPKLWSDTKGQPWLVNALAYQITWKNRELRDRAKKITFEHYMRAREELIYSRATHLDQLTDKLKEARVKRVISAIISSENFDFNQNISVDDQEYLEDLGLITTKPIVEISNDIYREVIPRELTWTTQTRIANQEQVWYIREDGSLDFIKLLKSFQQFFRENSDSWIEKFSYKEAGPQLLLQAFLQRIINGGGRINREYGLGRKRTDIFIEWPTTQDGFFGDVQKIVIETKILYSNLEKTVEDGMIQTKEYMSIVGANEGYLIIFDRSSSKSWDEKIWLKEIDGFIVFGG